jgi:hypothetical protein
MRTNDVRCGWLIGVPQLASADDTLYGSEGQTTEPPECPPGPSAQVSNDRGMQHRTPEDAGGQRFAGQT